MPLRSAPRVLCRLHPHACSLHPYDPGHQTLAELLAEPLVRAVWEVQAGLALAEGERRRRGLVLSLYLTEPHVFAVSVDNNVLGISKWGGPPAASYA
mgnify:CR=1 FL=1